MPDTIIAVNKRIKGIEPAPAGIWYNYIFWYVPKKIAWIGIIKNMKTLVMNLLLIFLLFNFCYAQDAIVKLENAYKNINDANGSFMQTNYIKELNKNQQFKGVFFIKGNKIRWQYIGEFPQTIYINNKTLTIYDKKKKTGNNK